jgi:cytochrome P450
MKMLPKTKRPNPFANTDVRKTLIEYVEDAYRKYGDTFQIDLIIKQLYASADPDFIKHVLQTNQKNYAKSDGYKFMKLGLGNGLVTSEGDYWRKQRRLAQPAFYKNNLENLYIDMNRTVKEYVEELNAKRGQTIDFSKEMMTLTATIVLRSLFSVEESTMLDNIYLGMEHMQSHIMKQARFPLKRWWYHINGEFRTFKKELQVFDDLVYGIINERRQSGENKPDLLQMLMDVEDADTGEKMTDLQLRDELVTMFSAGHETSANALAWTWYLLCQNPEVVAKLKTEANEVLHDGHIPTFEDLRKLQYTKQVIEEGMRLYPPAWVVGRKTIEQDVVNGYTIPKGQDVLLEIYLMHRNENVWENPLKFDPDRFLPEKVKDRPNHHYLPFGAGPRMCIGNHFAMMEMQLIVATLIQRFDFKLIENHPVKMDPLITLRPKYGILMEVS